MGNSLSRIEKTTRTKPRRKLTDQERLFVEAYCGPARYKATRAAELAGYQSSAEGTRLMRTPRIRRAIDRMLGTEIAPNSAILRELSEVATAEISNFERDITNKDGEVVGVRIDLRDRNKASEILLKARGAFRDPFIVKLEMLAEREVRRAARARAEASKSARIAAREERAKRLASRRETQRQSQEDLAELSPGARVLEAEVVQELSSSGSTPRGPRGPIDEVLELTPPPHPGPRRQDPR
jgi:phage terminase small subunit